MKKIAVLLAMLLMTSFLFASDLRINRFWQRLFGKKEVRLLVLGLPGAGKSTYLEKSGFGEVVKTRTSTGFEFETVEHKNISLTCWDLVGPDKIRSAWEPFYPNTRGIIFMVDSADRKRLQQGDAQGGSAKAELDKLLREEELKDAILLVFANKQDLPNVMSVSEITNKLGLNQLKGRQWFIQAGSVMTGKGVSEGLDWLVTTLMKKK